MKDDNLFLALRKYTPGPNIDPKENFLTEAFAWVLRQHSDLAGRFLRFVLDQYDEDFSIDPGASARWLTQEGNASARLDMVADLGDRVVIFEHKVWSTLGEDQIKKYRDYGAQRWKDGVLVVLITPRRDQHEQDPDVALTWGQVYRQVRRWMDDQDQIPQMVKHFLGLLRAEGLGPPAPVSHEALLAYLPAQTVVPRLGRLVQEVARRDWAWLYNRVAWPGQKREPFVRFGRGGSPKWGGWVWICSMGGAQGSLWGRCSTERTIRLRPLSPTWGQTFV